MTKTNDRWWCPWREEDGAVILRVDLTPDAEREARAVSLLDDAETARWHRFLSDRARREFALCRAALRLALSQRLGCTRRQLSFGRLEHGKPFAMVDGQRADVGFNVSHSGRHGLIAIAQRDGIGIDVEERVAQRDLEGIGSLVYGPVERRLLASATGRERVHLFYRLWSMKEALIKALGTGFSLSPREFEIPGPMLQAAKSGEFRFPHAPSDAWRLLDLGGSRFAAALACRLPSSSRSNPAPGGE